MNVKISMEKHEDGYYVTTCASLPGCISQGKTQDEALENMKEAVKLHIKLLMEDGIPLDSKSQNDYILQVTF